MNKQEELKRDIKNGVYDDNAQIEVHVEKSNRTINITQSLKSELIKLKLHKRETFNDVIRRLIHKE